MPFGGAALKQTYCTGTCTTASNWTDTAAQYVPFALVLDPAGEFVPAGGGSACVATLDLLRNPMEHALVWIPE
jgi:hypothetical protein